MEITAIVEGLTAVIVQIFASGPLRDEGEAYADALHAAGVQTKRHQGAGLIHGYFGKGEASEAALLEQLSSGGFPRRA